MKNMNQYINELDRLILHGLSSEWENAIFELNPYQRRHIRAPIFSLRDMNSRWGHWDKVKREISLSRRLVLEHSWDAVREVLLHEIAHQYADEVLYAHNETPHGPLFQKACHILKANPKASGDYTPIDERISSCADGAEDKLLRQIKKLMALAESRNRHEAEAAMAKAHSLIEKYNIDLLAANKQRDYASRFAGKPALRHTRADYLLASLINDFYFVKVIWISAYVLEKGKMGRVLELNGAIKNLQTASYVYDFVSNFINQQWVEYNRHKGLGHYRRIDFSCGILEGFRQKLLAQEEDKKKDAEERAIIKVEDPMLIKYFRYKYPRIITFRRDGNRRDENVVNDGKKIGKTLVISKGITEKAGGGYLLEHP
ncbi:DUF2786 domain-containing protein [bacterium]|nr:DUF2786 domain-containing protein [bacterium]